MFRRLVLIPALVVVLCALVSSPLLAQSKQEGIRLFNDAKALKDKAQSNADLQRAVQKYQQALAILERVGFKQGIGATANNLGNVFKDWGQYGTAVEYFEKSLAIRRELEDRKGEGQTLNNLGNVFENWGQYDKAVEYYEKSLGVAKKVGDVAQEGQTLNNLGIVYYDQGQLTKAEQLYEKALEIKRKTGDARGRIDPHEPG